MKTGLGSGQDNGPCSNSTARGEGSLANLSRLGSFPLSHGVLYFGMWLGTVGEKYLLGPTATQESEIRGTKYLTWLAEDSRSPSGEISRSTSATSGTIAKIRR